MITISGLTTRQKTIMELLWTCQTVEQVRTLIAALPSQQDVVDAHSLVNIAMMESLEEDGELDRWEGAACEAIDRAR
jgi:hypothetical protein